MNCANFTSAVNTLVDRSVVFEVTKKDFICGCVFVAFFKVPWLRMANNIVLATERYIHVHVAHFAIRKHRSLVTGAYKIHLSRPFRLIFSSVFSFLRKTSARRIRCAFHHIVIVSEQRIANQTPYNTWFADHVGGANQIRFKAASPDTFVYRDHVQEIPSDYVASPSVLYRKRPIRNNLDFFSLRFRWNCGRSGLMWFDVIVGVSRWMRKM